MARKYGSGPLTSPRRTALNLQHITFFGGLSAPTVIRRAIALLLAAAALSLSVFYAAGNLYAVAALMAGGASVWFGNQYLIAAIPVAFVAGDFYPLTGNLLVTESDFFLLGGIAIWLWRNDPIWSSLKAKKLFWIPVATFGLSVCISFILGWHVLPVSAPIDQLNLYATQWNALRVLKGYVAGLVITCIILTQTHTVAELFRYFAAGMQISAILVAVAVMIERQLIVGVCNFHELYRPTGPFFSMHTGGLQIDAFWAIALPFLFLPPRRTPSALSCLYRAFLIVAALYAIAATMSRGIIAWSLFIGITTPVLIAFYSVTFWRLRTRYLFGFGAAGLAILSALLVLQSDAVAERFQNLSVDWQTRWNHWTVIQREASQGGKLNPLFGNGLGATPSLIADTYQLPRSPAQLVALPDGRTALRLTPGKSVYVEQLVDIHANAPWTIVADVRSAGNARCHFHICAKTMLQSSACVETSLPARLDFREWIAFEHIIPVERVQSQRHTPIPTTFAMSASGDSGYVEIASLSLKDIRGNQLLSNANFREGSAGWFFTSDDLLFWRAENVWVHVYAEQGWLGVLSFVWLFLGAFAAVFFRASVRLNSEDLVVVTAMLGWLAIGTFGSLLDTPLLVVSLFMLYGFSHLGARRPLSNVVFRTASKYSQGPGASDDIGRCPK